MQGSSVRKKAPVQGGWIEQDTQDTEWNTDSVRKTFQYFYRLPEVLNAVPPERYFTKNNIYFDILLFPPPSSLVVFL